jgi:hypothetical protein
MIKRNITPKKVPIKGEVTEKVKEAIPCSVCNKFKPLANKTKKICVVCNKKIKTAALKEKKAKARIKKAESISVLTKKLDTVISQYVRLKYADQHQNVKCFTCDNKIHWKGIQNGHFQSRRYMSTRFHENNMRPQCYACNLGLSGNQYVYGINLDKEKGPGTAESMVLLAKQQKKFTPDELKGMIGDYEHKVEDLKIKLNIV